MIERELKMAIMTDSSVNDRLALLELEFNSASN